MNDRAGSDRSPQVRAPQGLRSPLNKRPVLQTEVLTGLVSVSTVCHAHDPTWRRRCDLAAARAPAGVAESARGGRAAQRRRRGTLVRPRWGPRPPRDRAAAAPRRGVREWRQNGDPALPCPAAAPPRRPASPSLPRRRAAAPLPCPAAPLPARRRAARFRPAAPPGRRRGPIDRRPPVPPSLLSCRQAFLTAPR